MLPLAKSWVAHHGSIGVNLTAGDDWGRQWTHLDFVRRSRGESVWTYDENGRGGSWQGKGKPEEEIETFYESGLWVDVGSASAASPEVLVGERIAELGFSSVKEFQSANGLEADGVVGPKTVAALQQTEPRRGGGEPSSVDVLNDYGTGIPQPLTLGEVRPRRNPLGEDVRARIAELGFDGDDAVKDFQRANNLEANGIVGRDTIAAAKAPNVVRADGRRQRVNLFGREPHVVPAPLTGIRQPSKPAIRPRSFDPNVPLPRPRPDLSGKRDRSGALAKPRTIATVGKQPGMSTAAEIEEIRRKMRQERRAYFADEALQARYRELISLQQPSRLR